MIAEELAPGELVEIDGARFYAELGGNGPALTFIHGFTLDHRLWLPQRAAFGERYRMLAYDQRGHGRSSLPDGPYSHAEDAARLLEHFAIERTHVVALSVGAIHALELAVLRPELVASLTLVDTSALGSVPFPPERLEMFAKLRALAATEGVPAAKAVWRSSPWFAPALNWKDARSVFDAQLESYSGWHWLNTNPERRIDPPVHDRLGEIRVPTLLIAGERDLPYNHRILEVLHAGIAGAKQHVLPGVGHLPNLEDPTAFNQVLADFLRELG